MPVDLSGVLDRMQDAYVAFDSDLRYVAVNPAAERSMGRRAADLMGRTLYEAFPDSVDSDSARNYRHVVAEGVEAHFVEHYVGDGLDVFVEVDAYPLGDGPPWGVSVFWRDVSLRERATHALEAANASLARANAELVARAAERERLLEAERVARRHAEAAQETEAEARRGLETERTLLRAVFDQLPVGAAIVEAPSGRILYVNPLGERLLGHTIPLAVDVSAYGVFRACHDDGTPFMPDEYPTARATRGEFVHEEVLRYRRDDGRVVHLALNAAPVYDAEGRLVRAVTTWQDVTERVALDDALRAARDAAEAARERATDANRAKSQFLANMSHELRTPLNAIAGHVQLIELGIHGPVTGEQGEALRRVQGAQRHLLRLVSDVLDFAKLEAGKVAFDLRPVSPASVVLEAVALVEAQATTRGVRLDVALPNDADHAPAAARAWDVWADVDKLLQVVLNLLANSIKFTPAVRADGAPGHVTIAVTAGPASSGVVYLHVRDNGIGIPADRLAHVFDPFVQVNDGLTRRHEGTGLGLAISHDLVHGMGGWLSAESVEGEGSTFTITLRRAMTDEGEWTERRSRSDRRHLRGGELSETSAES